MPYTDICFIVMVYLSRTDYSSIIKMPFDKI